MTTSEDDFSARIAILRNRIESACQKSHRNPREICVLGATKTQSYQAIQSAYAHNIHHVGENYLQEALNKQDYLKHCNIQWHFIGKLQSRKAKLAANRFSWVHSVDSIKLAQKLSQHRTLETPLNVLVQVNIDGESSKAGVDQSQLLDLCQYIDTLDNLVLRGIMVLPAIRSSFEQQSKIFARTAQLLQDANQQLGLCMNQLSMGMSKDLEAAIEQGSTIIRIGTDLFGARTKA